MKDESDAMAVRRLRHGEINLDRCSERLIAG